MKKELRAARANVTIMGYIGILLLTAVPLAGIFLVGIWINNNDKLVAEKNLAFSQQILDQYGSIKKDAQTLASDIVSAQSILSGGVSFGDLLTSIAASVPQGVILNNLTLGASQKAPLDINGRAKSYDDAVNLKNSLEQSDIFENVNIISISRTTGGSNDNPVSAQYLYAVSVRAQLSTGEQSTSNTGTQ